MWPWCRQGRPVEVDLEQIDVLVDGELPIGGLGRQRGPVQDCSLTGSADTVSTCRSITTGRVEGLTCQVYRQSGPTVMVVSKVSWMEPSQVGVAKVFRSRSVAPAGALPVSRECVAGLTAFSRAIKYASRFSLPA
jgi:hypothetical protein